jgi:spermidine/putrescine transport system permease protein
MRLPRWLIGFGGLVYLFLHLPILVLVLFSFNRSRYGARWTGFTWEWYRRLLERDDILSGLRVSLIVGVTATLLSALFGTLIALALARYRFRGRTLVEAFLYLPLVTPEIVVGISLLILYVLLRIPLGITTIVVAHVAFSISFVVVVVLARLQGMDRHLEEAALTLGADELTAFRKVTLPLLWPGILSGALLAFTMSLDDFVITSFVSGAGSSTLPIVVYGMVRKNIEPSINAISTIVLSVSAAFLYLASRLGQARPPA